jgi:hypothetical protein
MVLLGNCSARSRAETSYWKQAFVSAICRRGWPSLSRAEGLANRPRAAPRVLFSVVSVDALKPAATAAPRSLVCRCSGVPGRNERERGAGSRVDAGGGRIGIVEDVFNRARSTKRLASSRQRRQRPSPRSGDATSSGSLFSLSCSTRKENPCGCGSFARCISSQR